MKRSFNYRRKNTMERYYPQNMKCKTIYIVLYKTYVIDQTNIIASVSLAITLFIRT